MSEFASFQYKQGLKAAQEGRFQDAIALFTRALEIKPDYIDALKARGDVRFESGDIDGAIKDMEAHGQILASEFMSTAKEYEQRAERRLQLGDKEGAKEFFRLAVKSLEGWEEFVAERI